MTRSIVAFTTLMVLGLLLIWGGMYHHILQKKPVVFSKTTLDIKRGDTLESVIKNLRDQRIAINPFWFKLYAYRSDLDRTLKVGEYVLDKDATAADILALLEDGSTRQYTITFPEGWSFKKVFQAIQDNPNLQHTLTDEELASVMEQLGSDKSHPEGLFFPDTYYFEKNSSDLELLKRAHDKMQRLLVAEWQKRDQDVPLESPYEALILASIIEKETAAVEERKKIAGVFSRRLKKGMRLQTDPTVIYGMGDKYRGNIHKRDLREPTPYNTYVNNGLPPTPISMPGKAAIHAALHPADGDELFFVARGHGRHAFSAEYSTHVKYVALYQR
ncbi:aminodeoxychorismate lyase [Methylomonas lenta]|uniref:Endolytic murein transglycosylase n=1 Tax=Methylomonas lenta TaxID=980561 RepID=A0A177MVG1_9GAMM|nr:endolytic transglycosylase MltG [Methylomonas lenta]OAI09717.1 aminodeoxychorismate lyase [Methylomonas lenta]